MELRTEESRRIPSIEALNQDKKLLRKIADKLASIGRLPEIYSHRRRRPDLYRIPSEARFIIGRKPESKEYEAWGEFIKERQKVPTSVWLEFPDDELSSLRFFLYNKDSWELANIYWQGQSLEIELSKNGKTICVYPKTRMPEDLFVRITSWLTESRFESESREEDSRSFYRREQIRGSLFQREFLDNPLGFFERFRETRPKASRLMTMDEYKEYLGALKIVKESKDMVVVGKPTGYYRLFSVEKDEEYEHQYNPQGLFLRLLYMNSDLEVNPLIDRKDIPAVVEQGGKPLGVVNLILANVSDGGKSEEKIEFDFLFNNLYWINRWRKYGSAYKPEVLARFFSQRGNFDRETENL